jgi:hypothetical protein
MIPASWAIHLPNEAEWEKAARGGIQIPARPWIAGLKPGGFAAGADLIQISSRPVIIPGATSLMQIA